MCLFGQQACRKTCEPSMTFRILVGQVYAAFDLVRSFDLLSVSKLQESRFVMVSGSVMLKVQRLQSPGLTTVARLAWQSFLAPSCRNHWGTAVLLNRG